MRYATMMAAASLGLSGLPAEVGACEEARAVQNWYLRYLQRPADRCGLDNWVTHLRRGMAPDTAEASILGSEEYYHNHGCNPDGFVTGLYEDVLGRRPCREEVCTWTRRLGACGCRIKLASEFLCAARRELAGAAAPPVYVPEFPAEPTNGLAPAYLPVRPVPMVRPGNGVSLRLRVTR